MTTFLELILLGSATTLLSLYSIGLRYTRSVALKQVALAKTREENSYFKYEEWQEKILQKKLEIDNFRTELEKLQAQKEDIEKYLLTADGKESIRKTQREILAQNETIIRNKEIIRDLEAQILEAKKKNKDVVYEYKKGDILASVAYCDDDKICSILSALKIAAVKVWSYRSNIFIKVVVYPYTLEKNKQTFWVGSSLEEFDAFIALKKGHKFVTWGTAYMLVG